MKKISTLLTLLTLTALLLVGCADMDSMSGIPVNNPAESSAEDTPATVAREGVISDRLADAFAQNNGEIQRVVIYLKNEVEIPNQREQMKDRAPATTQDPALTAPEEYPNQHAIEAKQAEIMASRNAAKEAYLKQNNAFAEKYLEGKVDYVSLYSPIIIAYLDADEVNELALLSEVVKIDLHEVNVATSIE